MLTFVTVLGWTVWFFIGFLTETTGALSAKVVTVSTVSPNPWASTAAAAASFSIEIIYSPLYPSSGNVKFLPIKLKLFKDVDVFCLQEVFDKCLLKKIKEV